MMSLRSYPQSRHSSSCLSLQLLNSWGRGITVNWSPTGRVAEIDLWVIKHHSESWGIQVQYARECSEKICTDPWFLTPFTDWNFHLACYLVGLNFDLQNWGPWGGNFCSKHVHGSGADKFKTAIMPVSVCKNKGKGFSRFKKFAYRGSTQHHMTFGYRYRKNFNSIESLLIKLHREFQTTMVYRIIPCLKHKQKLTSELSQHFTRLAWIHKCKL